MRYLFTILISLLCMSSLLAQRSKMSPLVREAARAGMTQSCGAKGMTSPQQSYLMAFVQSENESVLYRHGCQILAQWDDLYIAAIPLSEIDALAAEKQVERIEAGKSCSLTNDTTATITRARDVWQWPYAVKATDPAYNDSLIGCGYTGKGVVLGVMDVGFDLTNPTLLSRDSTTYRVKRMWDMLDHTQGGVSVTGQTIPDGYFVGRQYIGYDSLMRKQHSTDGLIQYHGSHTVGTAAGSGAPFLCKDGEPVFSGMAPDADICLVSNAVGGDESLITEDDEYKYTTATDMLGFKYIFDYADSVGKPCVISFSEGAYEDLYQSGIYNKVMSKLVGPGHILCASAGNEATKGTYIHKEKGDSLKGAFLSDTDSISLYVLRSPKPPVISLRFYDNSYTPVEWQYDASALADYPDSLFMDTIQVNAKKFCVILNTYPSCYNSALYATDMYVIDMQNSNIGYTPVALVLTDKDNDVEAFANGGYFVSSNMDSSLNHFTNDHSVLFPGCLDDVICVGNAGYRYCFANSWGQKIYTGYTGGKIHDGSSRGPSMNGNMKPEVVAPGVRIISSFNSFYSGEYANYWRYYYVRTDDYNGRTYPYMAMTGTSMSTPVVAGIVALWLQACPTLSPDDVRDVIANTSSHYDESLSWPNNTYGYGEIDAKAGLEYIHKKYYAASDVNKDTYTNISDVNAVISAICGDDTFNSTADVNADGQVTISDVNAVIAVICGGKE